MEETNVEYHKNGGTDADEDTQAMVLEEKDESSLHQMVLEDSGWCGWDLLPVEIIEYILSFARESQDGVAWEVDVVGMVCRCVCRQWRVILPAPSLWILCKLPAVLAMLGDLHLLMWAREERWHWDASTCSSAAEGGHLDVLQWVRENGCPWDEDTCHKAAYRGHLDVLRWARENGCPWDEETTSWAAYGGQIEVLRWVRENGCPWDPEVSCWAAQVSKYPHHVASLTYIPPPPLLSTGRTT